jgi:DNA-binding beta-propeller fold protein YncE
LSNSHIDPNADPSRRAWLACPNCDHGAGCAECHSRRNCDTHWQYLLKNTAAQVVLQCPTCYCVWTVDRSERARRATTRRLGKTGHGADPPPETEGDRERGGAVIAKVSLGNGPRDIVTNPSGELVYVMTTHSVKAINKLHQVVASVPIRAEEPKQMMMSSDGSRIYVTGYDGALSIIDTAGMTVKTVAKQRTTSATVSPDGDHIYLAHGDVGSAWLSAIRADGAAVAFAAVDGFTTGMAVSPNGRRLYVASAVGDPDDRGGSIAVIDTTSFKSVDSIAVCESPDSISVDAEGLLYVTHFHTNSVSVVDPGTHCCITVALDDAPMEVMARPQTEFIYTANSHSVTSIDTTTAATTNIMLGELPRRLAIGADGRRLYATDFAHGTLWCVDALDNSVVTTVAICAHPAAVHLSPDGERLYVTDSRDGTLTVIATALLQPNSPETA